MIEKYQKKGLFDNVFKPTSYSENKNLLTPKPTLNLSTPDFYSNIDTNQELDKESQGVYANGYRPTLNVSNENEDRLKATGLNYNKEVASGSNTNLLEAKGATSGVGTSKSKLPSYEDYMKGVKGSGIKGIEALQMASPYILDALFKPKGAEYKRTQDVINPATGLPYEAINQAEQNINRGLRGLSRNKSSDILTNMVNMNMGQANANQQLNDIQVKNADRYLGYKQRMIGDINKNKDANDSFYNNAERERAAVDAQNVLNKKTMVGNTINQLGQIDAQNQAEKEGKKEKLGQIYQQKRDLEFQTKHPELVNAATVASNNLQNAKQKVAYFKTVDNNSSTDKTSADYIKLKQDSIEQEALLKSLEEDERKARTSRDTIYGKYQSEGLNQLESILRKNNGGLLFKQGGSLSVIERKELKEHEYVLKEKLNNAKEKAKEATEKYKDLKKQELEFRKQFNKSYVDNSKIISNFYKK